MHTLPENRRTPTELPAEYFRQKFLLTETNLICRYLPTEYAIGDTVGIYRRTYSVGIY